MSTRTRRAPSRLVAGLGALYVVLAVVGIATAGWHEFGLEEPVRMLGLLGVSTLLNIVHGMLGLALVVAGLRRAIAAVCSIALVAFAVMAVFGGVAKVFGGSGDPLNLNWWNVALYLLSVGVCGYGTAVATEEEA
jgi:hypothetical protein